MTRLSLTLVLLAALTGCSSYTHYVNSQHPAFGQAELDRDNYDCQRENARPSMAIVGGFGTAGTTIDDDMVHSCLAARGWHPG